MALDTSIFDVLKSAYPNTAGAAYGGLAPRDYDELVITYSGSNVSTVVYKKASATICTLTLTYTGSNVTRVVRT